MQQKPILNYPSQFALLLALLGIGMILGNLTVLSIGSLWMHVPMKLVPSILNDAKNANLTRTLNTLASLLVFGLPAFALSFILTKNPFQYLNFQKTINSKQIILVISIAFVSLVLSGALGELNENIPLPAKWLETARKAEAQYKESMMAMIKMKDWRDWLISILVMAMAPAIFEEVLFRGALQQILIGWMRNAFIGILVASILFSAIHFSFFGFLPRVALGMILGWVFYYSKNLWMNMLIHFLYNGFIVTQIFIAGRQGKQLDKSMDESMPIWLGALALAVILYFMQQFKKASDYNTVY